MADDSRGQIAAGAFGAILLHAAFVVAVIIDARAPDKQTVSLPSAMRMTITQAGPVSVGVVQEAPTDPVPPTPAPRAAEVVPPPTKAPATTQKTKPVTPIKQATVTPNAAKTAVNAPTAGAGTESGKGADLANVEMPGTEFPFPQYQRNIINSIAANFHPGASRLHAEVMFVIRKDGSVEIDDARLLTRSTDYRFDIAALAAIEAAANKKLFGRLPDGFSGDALTVIFKFDPKVITP